MASKVKISTILAPIERTSTFATSGYPSSLPIGGGNTITLATHRECTIDRRDHWFLSSSLIRTITGAHRATEDDYRLNSTAFLPAEGGRRGERGRGRNSSSDGGGGDTRQVARLLCLHGRRRGIERERERERERALPLSQECGSGAAAGVGGRGRARPTSLSLPPSPCPCSLRSAFPLSL